MGEALRSKLPSMCIPLIPPFYLPRSMPKKWPANALPTLVQVDSVFAVRALVILFPLCSLPPHRRRLSVPCRYQEL